MWYRVSLRLSAACLGALFLTSCSTVREPGCAPSEFESSAKSSTIGRLLREQQRQARLLRKMSAELGEFKARLDKRADGAVRSSAEPTSGFDETECLKNCANYGDPDNPERRGCEDYCSTRGG